MNEKVLNPGQILTGALFNEPMRVETVQPNGPSTWVLGLVGVQSEKFRKVTLSSRDLAGLKILESVPTYDGDGNLLRLGLQAYSLGIAYEFDPYFGLSIFRVDPLPHQLEAVYDYLLKVARVRFLLAVVGGIPPEIWNRLGTKIIPKLKSGSDLKIGVDFSVALDAGNVKSLESDLRQIL
jgi:hypothetical protein